MELAAWRGPEKVDYAACEEVVALGLGFQKRMWKEGWQRVITGGYPLVAAMEPPFSRFPLRLRASGIGLARASHKAVKSSETSRWPTNSGKSPPAIKQDFHNVKSKEGALSMGVGSGCQLHIDR